MHFRILYRSRYRGLASTGRLFSTTRPRFDFPTVPQDENEQFEVPIHEGCFKTYDMDAPPTQLSVTKSGLRDLYIDMYKIRRMETAIDRLYKERKVRGFCHSSVGQEAVAVGVEHGIEREDKVITAYRCHGNVLMRGASVKQIVAEVLGRRGGLNFGKGGSVHMYYKNFFGGNGIVGAQVPIGAGIAFAQQYEQTGRVTVSLYGDGAANQGQVFEAFNMAKLWNLPVIFACENNQFGMGTSALRASANIEFYKRGQYIPGLWVDGMDVLAVTAAMKYGKQLIAEGFGPLVYEFAAYRFYGHSVSDPGTSYRTRKEVQDVRDAQDPVLNYRKKLLNWGVFESQEIKSMEDEVQKSINAEVDEAEQIPAPDATPQNLFEDSYVRGSEPKFVRGRIPDENFYFANDLEANKTGNDGHKS